MTSSRKQRAGPDPASSPAPRNVAFSFSPPSTSLSYVAKPPDLSGITEASVAISFKNIQKKDGTTKTKALEDLVAHAQANPFELHGGVEDAVLDAWVCVYPRVSIDNSRRVRELSHAVQLAFMTSARRRMEKRIPAVVGAWLAGTFDRDRGASRTASDGLFSLVNTPDKVLRFWKQCQAQILDYATAAILETPSSLDDDRSTSKDDAEAKYYRVISGSLSLVLGLLQKLEVSDHEQLSKGFDEYFAVAAVWKGVTTGDALVRRTTCQLLWTFLDTREASVHKQLPRLKRILVGDGLGSDQTGSAAEYVRILTRLTEEYPEIWSGTKQQPPLARVCSFLEKGSQGSPTSGPLNYWKQLEQFLSVVPQQDVSLRQVSDLAKSLRTGISKESRLNALDAWTVYLSTITRLLSTVGQETSRAKLVEANIYPLLEHYLWPVAERTPWSTGAILPLVSQSILAVFLSPYPELVSSIQAEWTRLNGELASRMANSLPEVSEDHLESQQSIATLGERWFALVAQVYHGFRSTGPAADSSAPRADSVLTSSQDLLQRASALVVTRNYKPFGVASFITTGFVRCPFLLSEGGGSVAATLFPASNPEASEALATSPSLPFLLSFLNTLGADAKYVDQYTAAFEALSSNLIRQNGAAALQDIARLLGTASASRPAQESRPIQGFLSMTWLKCAQGRVDAWDLLKTTMSFDSMSPSTTAAVTRSLIALLQNTGSDKPNALRALAVIAETKPQVVIEEDAPQLDLETNLMELTEMSDPAISSPATTLRSLLGKTSGSASRLVKIIQNSLESTRPSPVSIQKLAHEALELVKSGSVAAEAVLPSTNTWMSELSRWLQGGLNPALSLTSGLGGAYFLGAEVHRRPGERGRGEVSATSMRMALYTSKMLASTLDLSALPQRFHVELLYLLCLVAEVASDELAINTSAEHTQGTGDLIPAIRASMMDVAAGAPPLRDALIDTMLRHSRELTPLAVYTTRALSEVFQLTANARGFSAADEERLTAWDILKATPATALPAIAVLTGFGEFLRSSKLVSTLCNRLISDVAGLHADSDKTLLTMVVLNANMAVYDNGQLPVANNRAVFAVKQITAWFEDSMRVDGALAAESCRALQRLLPHIKDVYGPHWERAIRFCLTLWRRADMDDPDQRLPYIQSSVKLMAVLQALPEPNDDLGDALEAAAAEIASGMLTLLSFPRDGVSQAEAVVDALLRRRTEMLSLDSIKDADVSELYGLVGSESQDVQMASFGILHKVLPATQQKFSMDVLLEKRVARLPDELLSLLLDAPTLETYSEKELAGFPTAVRSYLLSWHLVFDAYASTSSKVRNDYTELLKSMDHVSRLLDFTFDVLGHTAGHPLNLDKEGLTADLITSYDPRLAGTELEEKQMHWLLVHIYFLTLKYIPGLFKAWYLDCKSKQTKLSVESWTTKYLTPLITSEMLEEVQVWANSQQPPPDDEKELLVRVTNSANTKEVVAGYEVDELTASMAIRIPPSYPIDVVSVVGINRVAVSEKKWQNWLLATQGVIMFSNGSIIDGLLAFRRNVVGALKGQTECAICYSIISVDKKMPDRRCGTCKNLFHRSCLYKWFQTSNQNTCPLCRNPIDYLGAETNRRRALREE